MQSKVLGFNFSKANFSFITLSETPSTFDNFSLSSAIIYSLGSIVISSIIAPRSRSLIKLIVSKIFEPSPVPTSSHRIGLVGVSKISFAKYFRFSNRSFFASASKKTDIIGVVIFPKFVFKKSSCHKKLGILPCFDFSINLYFFELLGARKKFPPAFAFRPATLPEYLEGRTPKEKHPFLFQNKFHPRQSRNARRVFSFGVAE